jgi:hypothetical protein
MTDVDETILDRVFQSLRKAQVRYWRDFDGNAYATIHRQGRIARYKVRSDSFALAVRTLYGHDSATGNGKEIRPGIIPSRIWSDVVLTCEAFAQVGQTHNVDVRIVRYDGAIWLDLGDESWVLVRITEEGWRIVEGADVPLIRPQGMRPLFRPVSCATAWLDFELLLNLPDKTARMLIVAWLVAVLFYAAPYPILAIDGEAGTAKSTLARMLRRLIDPNKADHRAPPRNEEDLLIAALNGAIVNLDNISGFAPAIADALCRLATGAGLSKRRLYSDGDEFIIGLARAVILNGIPSLLTRSDVADRSLPVTMKPIPDGARRSERDLWQEFYRAGPGILAWLLDGLVGAMQRLPTVKIGMLPRMADFARLAVAAAPSFGWTEQDMLSALLDTRDKALKASIESDVVTGALERLLDTVGGVWEGNATRLLGEICTRTPPDAMRMQGWPKTPRSLSGYLRRCAPALRKSGFTIEFPDGGGRSGRIIQITKIMEVAENTDLVTSLK